MEQKCIGTEEEKIEGLELYKPSLSHTPLVGTGINGKVFRISGCHVAKVTKWFDDHLDKNLAWLAHQKDIAERAYAANISVPKPVGVFDIKLRPLRNEKQFIAPEFVMEYIPGRTLDKVIDREREKVERIWNHERDRAWNAGFRGSDLKEGNAIWCPERKKVYLIDFEYWSYQTK